MFGASPPHRVRECQGGGRGHIVPRMRARWPQCALLASALAILASACVGAGSKSATDVVPSFSGPVNAVSVNAGGSASGEFRADQYFSKGATYGTDVPIDMTQISGSPPPSAVFNSERYGAMTYTIPQRTGPQSVTLYFVESYVTGPGERVFDVTINGTTVLSDFDIFEIAGGENIAVSRTFGTTADADGNVVIAFSAGIQEPKINAFTVLGAGTTPAAAPAAPSHSPAPPPATSADAKASAGCGKPAALEDGEITVEGDGTRSYVLRVPETYDSNHPYRLVLAYHWKGGTARAVADGIGATESPFFGLWDEANSSTIFVAPVGLGSGNDTGWANVGGQDVAFADAILDQVESGLCIDTTRVFAVGFSYGAGMSYALACARPEVFRGVALFSGAELSGCDGGSEPIALYASHGLTDGTLNIAWARSLRDHFLKVNGVAPQESDEPAVDSGAHVCTTYEGASPQFPVEWCAFDGGHTPNPHDDGQATSWSPAEVWKFISQF
jgi:poly(3-hydroxybutyrate) depolymerase